MKIGLFTDTYHPSTNGIVVVIDIIADNLKKMDHEVYVVAPRSGLTPKRTPSIKNAKVIWLPAIEGLLFDEYKTSIVIPKTLSNKLDKLGLEAIIFFTPGVTGMTGAYYAKRKNIILLQQYCTDLVAYIREYPNIVPILLAFSMTAPYMLKMNIKSIFILLDKIVRKRDKNYSWSQDTIRKVLTIVHNNCDGIISISNKMTKKLKKDGVIVPIKTIPTGVDKLLQDANITKQFKKQYCVGKKDILLLYVGRPAPEKNLEILIDAFCILAKRHSNLKLAIVGDYEFRPILETMVKKCGFKERIIFTGKIKRQSLGSVYGAADIFVFPSKTDAQGLVLNEAAHAGLPIVWCDRNVNDVVIDGTNGILASSNAKSFARAIEKLINDKNLRQKYGKNSVKLAQKFSEKSQTQKLVDLIKEFKAD